MLIRKGNYVRKRDRRCCCWWWVGKEASFFVGVVRGDFSEKLTLEKWPEDHAGVVRGCRGKPSADRGLGVLVRRDKGEEAG